RRGTKGVPSSQHDLFPSVRELLGEFSDCGCFACAVHSRHEYYRGLVTKRDAARLPVYRESTPCLLPECFPDLSFVPELAFAQTIFDSLQERLRGPYAAIGDEKYFYDFFVHFGIYLIRTHKDPYLATEGPINLPKLRQALAQALEFNRSPSTGRLGSGSSSCRRRGRRRVI